MCPTVPFSMQIKTYLVWVTRSRSPEWHSISSVFCVCVIGVALVPVPRSGYCWRGVVLVPCIGVCLRLFLVQRILNILLKNLAKV